MRGRLVPDAQLVSREQRISDPARAHVASYSVKPGVQLWTCLGCQERSESPALFCETCVLGTALRP
jgi:hypothetical protein